MRVYYDDRLDVGAISPDSPGFEILDQVCTSKAVGTTRPETEVLKYEEKENRIVAVGIGTATVRNGDVTYHVTVEPAPVSMVLIVGHSIGAGQCGTPEQCVLIDQGQAYSSHGRSALDGVGKTAGLGTGSGDNPIGIHNFTEAGSGTRGVDSGIAFKWNELTGEKIWVLNAAVPGSNLTEWQPGTDYFNKSVNLFALAQKLMQREIAAGHYILKEMSLVYFSGANYVNKVLNKNVQFTQADLKTWYEAMWSAYCEKFSRDMDGDGKDETVTAIGLVPIWSKSATFSIFGTDKPANYFMSTSCDYPGFYIAAENHRRWITDEMIFAEFPEVDYISHSQNVSRPNDLIGVFADGTHYNQVAYNALGIEIGEKLYKFLRTDNLIESVKLLDTAGIEVPENMELKVGQEYVFVPEASQVSAGGLTYTVSENLAISYPCKVTAMKPGGATLTIWNADKILLTVSFTIVE